MLRPALFAVLALATHSARAFYLPGIAPIEFHDGDHLPNDDGENGVMVQKLSSITTHLPYEYFELPFCDADNEVEPEAENLGQILGGSSMAFSGYRLVFGQDEQCKILCRKKYDNKAIAKFKEFIDDEYNVNMVLDNLPAATQYKDANDPQIRETLYEHGFPVGGIVPDADPPASRRSLEDNAEAEGAESDAPAKRYWLNNHLKIIVEYHVVDELDSGAKRIVGFKVEPYTRKHTYQNQFTDDKPSENVLKTCDPASGVVVDSYEGVPQLLTKEEGADNLEVVWTYDVQWVESPNRWTTRWDIYLSMGNRYDDEVHWFSIVNSVLIVVFLTGMVAMIMTRTLRRDVQQYNRVLTEEERAEEREESGWKLVHADVFRPPATNALAFCCFVGTGMQMIGMVSVTLLFAAVGFLSPANRGSMLIALILLYMFMGVPGGYNAARMCKMFNLTEWQRVTLVTAIAFPLFVGLVFFAIDLVVWGYGSSRAVPFTTMLAVLALWFFISVPLVFLGAFVGFRKDPIEHPVRTSQLPRQIPEQPWYLSQFFTALVGGVLPFGAVFVELFFIMSSLWLDQYYYVFGFLFLVFVIMIITCAEITIVLCYFQLCAEDYHWWWRSFFTSGASALYLFLYSAFYFFTKLEMTKFVSGMIYFGYMGIISVSFFLFTGAIGFWSCFWFTRLIYGSIKVD